MYHSITFGDKNTWDDWHLIPSSRPLFNPPSVKTQYQDIPGAHGKMDLTEALTGYPLYDNRTGSWEFYVMNDYQEWNVLYQEILNYLHGRRMTAFLEDEPEYYYEGRFSVNKWDSQKDWSRITIDYDVDPFKIKEETSTEDPELSLLYKDIIVQHYGIYLVDEEDWLWDPFNFDTGVISASETYRYDWSDAKIVHFDPEDLGDMPVVPKIIVNSVDGNGITVRLINPELDIDIFKNFSTGTHVDEDFIFSGIHPDNDLHVGLMGNGTISFEFNLGRL